MKRAFAKTHPTGCRRFAAGGDVSPAGGRAVVISQRLAGLAEIRVEHVGHVPLPPDAMATTEIVDPAAVAVAIVNALEAFFRHGAAASLRAVMALPPHATLLTTLPLGQCQGPAPHRQTEDAFMPGVPDRTL